MGKEMSASDYFKMQQDLSHTCFLLHVKLSDWSHNPREVFLIANSSQNADFCTCYFLLIFEITFSSNICKDHREF